jgi:hypothetical protein
MAIIGNVTSMIENASSVSELTESPHSDPLGSNEVLPLTRRFYPLGFCVDIATNSEDILQTAEESWGGFEKRFDNPALQLSISVSQSGSANCLTTPVYRSQKNLFSIIADGHNFAVCDLQRGFGFASLTKTTVRRRSYLRYHFLEAAVLTLLSASRATALHAGCVESAGRGLLLCGDTGAGKSSLAFACARAGWTYVSDDATYLIRNRKDRLVVGNSQQVRLRPTAADLFPELKGLAITPRPTGKPSIEVPITSLDQNIVTAPESRIHAVVFLNRREPLTQALLPYSKQTAQRWLNHSLFGTGEIREAQSTSVRELLEVDTMELRYRDLNWAVSRLDMLIRDRR